MGTLAKAFPEEDREQYASQNVLPGKVLYLWCDFGDGTRKDKYLVVACANGPTILLTINSDLHQNMSRNPRWLACQALLKASDYEFLSVDSWVNCAKINDLFDSRESVEEQLRDDPSRVRGDLSRSDRQAILSAAMRANTLTVSQKKAIVAALDC